MSSAAILVLLVVFPPALSAQLTVDITGKVVVGQTSSPNDLNVTGTLTAATLAGNGTIPIGTVIDWWRPDSSAPIPANFKICDGTAINDSASPYNGKVVPNLIGRFTQGVAASAIGTSGGAAVANPRGSTEYGTGAHSHGLPASTGDVYNGGADPGAEPYYVRDDNTHDGSQWSTKVHLRADTPDSTTEGQHRHALGGGTNVDGMHTHPVTVDPVATVPPWVGLLKIMRIK